MPKPLNSRAKEMVLSLISYFEKELENGGPLLPLQSVRERVANALDLSLSTVNHLSANARSGKPVCSPKRKRLKASPITNLSSSQQVAIRDVIYDMYKEKVNITLSTLSIKLKEKQLFIGSKSSLWRLIISMGFKYKKDDPRRGLMEISDIASKRIHFLHTYKQLQSQNLYQFVFLDETWIFQDGTIARSWQDTDVRSVKSTKVNGRRYIILHAGNEKGFINGAELVFSSATKNKDYHGEMNSENFLRWFEEQLLKNLEQPSIIVMDNAPYHSVVENKLPNSSNKKQEIQTWLTANKIPFSEGMLKTQLLQTVQENKPKKIFVADTLAQKYGHNVLRLPPYHCIFNPIEHVWSIAKSYYNSHVNEKGGNMAKCLQLWKESLQEVTPEKWSNCVRHTNAEIDKWWAREQLLDAEDIAPVIINVNSDDSESEDMDFSD